jgi:hypothetical protein
VGIILGVAIGVILFGSRHLILAGQGDFAPFYVASQLIGGEQLYDPAPYRSFLISRFGGTSDALIYIRPPFYAALLYPLGRLPYEHAHVVWMVLRLAALAGFVWLWRSHPRRTVLNASLVCFPILGSLVNGQDGLFLLFLLALTWRWVEAGQPLRAGLALSLCAIKFHLFLTLPIWLLSRSGRPLLKGFSLGAAGLVGISFATAGLRWPLAYYDLLRSSEVSPAVQQMPNLNGLLSGLPAEFYLQLAMTGAVAWACWKAATSTDRLYGFAAVLVGGLLTSYHSYFTDCMILLPAVLVIRSSDSRRILRTLSLLLLLPIPLLLSRPESYLAQGALLVVLFAMALRPAQLEAPV